MNKKVLLRGNREQISIKSTNLLIALANQLTKEGFDVEIINWDLSSKKYPLSPIAGERMSKYITGL